MSQKTNAPSLEQWKRLYELMNEIKGLAPWVFMYEHNIFGVRFPETGNLGFVSVMGNLGEHLAIAVYMGKKGFEGFLTMQRTGYELTPDMVLQVPQLQASLEDREMITPQDRRIIQQLGLKFRGKQAWPQFRSYRPGCFPWYLEAEEAQMLIYGLEQLIEVAPRFENSPNLLGASESAGEHLVRVYQNEKWTDQYQKIRFPADPPLQLKMNMDAIQHLKSLPKQSSTVEIDLQMMEQPVREKEFDRPYFPFLLMVAERQSKLILGADLLSPLPSLEAMWEEIPAVVTEILASYFVPKELQVKNPTIALLLSPLEKELALKVKLVSRLPTVEFAQGELRNFVPW
jgi:hypothetical protein